MAVRNGVPLDFIWVHVALAGGVRNRLKNSADTERGKYPILSNTVISVSENVAGTEAIIKVPAKSDWVDGLTAADRARVIRTFTERDHDEAKLIVQAPGWWPPDDVVDTIPSTRGRR